jgi:hypothetical protein
VGIKKHPPKVDAMSLLNSDKKVQECDPSTLLKVSSAGVKRFAEAGNNELFHHFIFFFSCIV